MAKVISLQEAAALIPDGATVMIGGFMGCGNPHKFIQELVKTGVKHLTLICDDAALPIGPGGEEYYGVAKLIHAGMADRLITTHVGKNPEVSKLHDEGKLTVDFIPQGSFAEMLRAGGSGLGGVLTPTGVGTAVEDSPFTHSKLNIDGRDYLLMRPLHAQFAVLSGYYVDKCGNIWYKGTTRNFQPLMATAADTVIVEADNLVEPGKILPENVMTPGMLVDYIVLGGAQ